VLRRRFEDGIKQPATSSCHHASKHGGAQDVAERPEIAEMAVITADQSAFAVALKWSCQP
jgi:hypothetical protein